MIRFIAIDLANRSFDNSACIEGLRIARYWIVSIYKQYFAALKKQYPALSYYFFTDASLIHRIDEPHKLDRDIRRGVVLECPAGIAADDFLLEFLNQHPEDTIIVSNDRFRDHQAPKTTRVHWRYPSMLARGELLVPGLLILLETECLVGCVSLRREGNQQETGVTI